MPFPSSPRFRAAVIAAALTPITVWAQSDTTAIPPLAAPAVTAPVRGAGPRLQAVAIAAIGAATFNQTLGLPEGWSRRWGGYGQRIGDQVAFAAIEEGVRLSLASAVGWRPDTLPCRGRRSINVSALLPRLGCAVRETVLVRTAQGHARPNLPLGIGALAAASASTLWRPDASTPSKALSLVVTRVAAVVGGTLISHLITDWQTDRK